MDEQKKTSTAARQHGSNEIEKLKKEVEDYKSKYLRALADYQNFERRVIQDRVALSKDAEAKIMAKFLPFLDNVEKAEVFIKDAGLKMVKDQFFQLVKSLGVEEIELVGKKYDPELSEAIEVVDGTENDIITEVVRKGYKMNGKVLQVAQVKVAKKLEVRS